MRKGTPGTEREREWFPLTSRTDTAKQRYRCSSGSCTSEHEVRIGILKTYLKF